MDNKNVKNKTNKIRSADRTSVTSSEKAAGNRSSLYRQSNQTASRSDHHSTVNNSQHFSNSLYRSNSGSVTAGKTTQQRNAKVETHFQKQFAVPDNLNSRSSHVSQNDVRETSQRNAQSAAHQSAVTNSLYRTRNNTPINTAHKSTKQSQQSNGNTVYTSSANDQSNRPYVKTGNNPSSSSKSRFVKRSETTAHVQSTHKSTGDNRRKATSDTAYKQPQSDEAPTPTSKNENTNTAVNNSSVDTAKANTERKGAFHNVKRAASGAAYVTGFIDPFRQTQIHLDRELQPDGKYARTVHFVHSKNYRMSYDGKFHGVFNAAHELNKTKLQGDLPSVTKKLNSIKPKTVGGKIGLGAVKGSYKLAKTTVNIANSSLLAAERGAVSAASHVVNAGKRKLSEELEKTDTGKALVKANAVRKFIRGQVQQRKLYKSQEKRIKISKQQLKQIKKSNAPKINKANGLLKSERKLLREQKKKLSNAKSPVKKQMLKARKKQHKVVKKEIKEYRSAARKLTREYKRQHKAEEKIAKLNGTKQIRIGVPFTRLKVKIPFVKTPLTVAKGLTSAAVSEFTNKLRSADKDNAALEAVSKGIDVAKKAKAVEKNFKLKNANRKASNAKAVNQRKNKLKQQENKLHKKDQPPKKKPKRKKRKKKNTFKENVKQAVKDTLSAVGVAVRGALKEVLLFLTPVMAFSLVAAIIFMIVMSAFSPVSQFLLGTYTASDQNLSEAVEVYTGYVNDMHKAIYDLSYRKNEWKKSLKALGVDVSDYKNKPDDKQFHYGRSDYFGYDPAEYDYDPYILWSFLCAYYYDFEKAEELRKQDKAYSPSYWTVTDDTENLLRELFDKEYTFEHIYLDASRWVELPKEDYNLISKKSRVYWDSFETTRVTFEDESEIPGQLKSFIEVRYEDDVPQYIIHYNYWTLEILNANKGDEKTGWYFQDKNENSEKMPELITPSKWGGSLDGTSIDGNEIWYAVAPWDTGIDNIAYVRFEKREFYNTDAALYYNVEQNCTFEEAIINLLREKKGSYADAAVEYYNLLIGKGEDSPKYHGNHQCMKSPVRATMQELIDDDRIFNWYGYDRVTAWNNNHCNNFPGMHNGIDIACHNGEQVLAMVDGEVTYVDDRTVTITAKDFELIYSEPEDNSRKYTINVSVLNIDRVVEKGDIVKTGSVIGTANTTLCCYQSNSRYWNDYDGYNCYIHCNVNIGRIIKEPIAPEMLIY